MERVELIVEGMTCESCALNVEQALKKVPGVHEVKVPGWQSRDEIVTIGSDTPLETLVKAVQERGYRAAVKTRQPVQQAPQIPSVAKKDGQFDLMVVGAGSAGFAAAIKGVELGFHVALVEAGTMGGTCVNIGCVPSKTLIRAVEQLHQASGHAFQGIYTIPGRVSWPEVVAQKDQLVTEMRQSKYADVLATYPEITYIKGQANLLGKNEVLIDGQTYQPGKIIVATGASPWAPPVPGLAESGYLTSTTAMDLKELPKSMIVLGANAVGLEMAQTFSRAGTYVSVVEVMPRILPFEDDEVSLALADYLEEEGIRMVTGFETNLVERREGRYMLRGMRDGAEINFEAEQLLVATGRRANTSGLGLEKAGVALGERGQILVDETLHTGNSSIYAAGDVTGKDMYVYTAAYGGSLAAENALIGTDRIYDAAYIPRVTFTDPQIASAGLTEEQARKQGMEVKVSKLPMSYVPRALAARDTRGFIKIVADSHTNRLVGAHILAPEAGEIIQAAVLAIRFGITLDQLAETMFPYLTNVEGIRLAALSFEKDVARLSCCAG